MHLMNMMNIKKLLNFLKNKIYIMNNDDIVLIEVCKLNHIENFSYKRVLWLESKIKNEKIWRVPLKIEKNFFLVMDGQHRMEVAKKLNLRYVPCILYDYNEVDVWSLRKTYEVTGDCIISNFKNNRIYPYKTAKHKFPYGEKKLTDIPLKNLK